jgi:2-(1,2-epoxy-1,2-dihydrophenyl)acetyl-CoA isomerase
MDTGPLTGFGIHLEDPGIAWFRFNTPARLNGMTTGIKRDLVEGITQAQMDNAVRVLVFTGSGRPFCAGDDLKAYSNAELGGKPLMPAIPPGHDNALGTYNGLRTISQRLNSTLRGLDKLTVAAINEVAIQTGFSLALGLLNDVVPADELDAAALSLARELANGPQVAIRLLKRSLYNAAELTWEQSLDEIAAKTAITDHHPDAQEGVRAFHDKRTASFNAWLGGEEYPQSGAYDSTIFAANHERRIARDLAAAKGRRKAGGNRIAIARMLHVAKQRAAIRRYRYARDLTRDNALKQPAQLASSRVRNQHLVVEARRLRTIGRDEQTTIGICPQAIGPPESVL